MRPRVTARISQTCRICAQGDHSGGRAAQRCYGTVQTETTYSSRTDSKRASPFHVAAAAKAPGDASISEVQRSDALLRRRSAASSTTVTRSPLVRNALGLVAAPTRTPYKSPYHIPEVLISAEDAKSTPGPKIHILGQDERSTFIAHALSGVYDSVSMLTWKPNPRARYQSVQRARNNGQRGFAEPERRKLQQETIGEDPTPISNLIVTDRGQGTLASLKSVSDQINKDTNICVVHDGFGVLEDVRRQFLNDGIDGMPRLYGGHLSHKLARNRKVDGVRQLKDGFLNLYEFREKGSVTATAKRPAQWEGPDLYGTLSAVPELHTEMMGYADWIAKKMPSVVFDTVVEPVCTFFDIKYEEMQYNKAALTLMNQLLAELKVLCRVAPEMQTATIQNFMGDNFIAAKAMLVGIGARRSMPCDLTTRMKSGLPTGVEHTVQYFLRRGKKLGVDMPRLEMMVSAVHTKNAIFKRELEDFVPMEEISLPVSMSFRHGLYENSARTLQELERGRRRHQWGKRRD
ncbi:ketopantoate reductase panE/ApbA domain-containing protein [Sarocladium implicatum]|nr:ketopantoate reductase panE/ApbA domain-containing protein [Sarocladium implicatum]